MPGLLEINVNPFNPVIALQSEILDGKDGKDGKDDSLESRLSSDHVSALIQ